MAQRAIKVLLSIVSVLLVVLCTWIGLNLIKEAFHIQLLKISIAFRQFKIDILQILFITLVILIISIIQAILVDNRKKDNENTKSNIS